MTEGWNPATPGRRVVEASAPCRVDLAGGALDAWPGYLFHPGAVTLTVAIDRRVSCRVETGVDGVVEIVRAAGGAAQAQASHGVVTVWAPPGGRGPGRREAVAAALRESGLRLLPVRVDLRGLDVEDIA